MLSKSVWDKISRNANERGAELKFTNEFLETQYDIVRCASGCTIAVKQHALVTALVQCNRPSASMVLTSSH